MCCVGRDGIRGGMAKGQGRAGRERWLRMAVAEACVEAASGEICRDRAM